MGHNKFSAMTPEEFKEQVVGNANMKRKGPFNFANLTATNNAASLDWVAKGAVTPIKDQAQCGSCWAFSTVAGMEGQLFVAEGKLLSMSEQDLVSCDKNGDQGCNGGLMDNAFEWIHKNGIAAESAYPYTSGTGTTGTCSKAKEAKPVVTVSSFRDVPKQDEDALKSAVSKQPVSIAIEVRGGLGLARQLPPPCPTPPHRCSTHPTHVCGPTLPAPHSPPTPLPRPSRRHPQADKSAFQLYKGGVLDNPACGEKLDHGVLVVGYGTDDSSGKDYWKVKNSWGATWGEQGFIRMVRGKNMCGVASQASYPKGATKAGPSPPSPSPTPPSPPAKSHYEDPKDGCQTDEIEVTIQGVSGDFCTPKCNLFKPCPTDVPSGVSAKPQCALQDSSAGTKYCALICSPTLPILDQKAADAQCGSNASCKSLSMGVGLCTYDD